MITSWAVKKRSSDHFSYACYGQAAEIRACTFGNLALSDIIIIFILSEDDNIATDRLVTVMVLISDIAVLLSFSTYVDEMLGLFFT